MIKTGADNLINSSGKKERFGEIDSLRGIAIAMMVWFHLLFDLSYFGIMNINVSTGFWRIFGYSTAILFVFIAGVSVFISSERSKKYLSGLPYYLKFLKRGLFLFLIGEIITFATWVVIGGGYIVFGILHLLGLSIILSPFFMRFKKYNLVLGIIVISAGFFVSGIKGPLYLIPLGLTPYRFYSLDYEPLFPWFGVFLLGISAGAFFYPNAKRRFNKIQLIQNSDNFHLIPIILEFPGKHSLIIYLIHQPLIILILSLAAGRILL